MVNYQNTKIYKIESHLGPKIYIGSTTKEYLSQRMDSHRSNYKQWKKGKGNYTGSYSLFDEYGLENCKIILIELFPCKIHDEKASREGYYIRSLNCVNKYIPGRTDKEYRQDNIDKIKEVKLEYRRNNIDKIKEPFNCECGGRYTHESKSHHSKTKKHHKYLESKNKNI